MYRLRLTRREKKRLLRAKWLILLGVLILAACIVWFIWIRPMQNESGITSFDECVAAGNPIQESYPEVCLTKDGKRFPNPKQDASHQAARNDEQELVPPTNPALLKLDIKELGIRVPLTTQTFDLSYTYVEGGGEEYVYLTYKRLVRQGVCRSDVGIKLNRRFIKFDPPYTADRPAPLAQAGTAYFYPYYTSDKSCYDDKNAEQLALVKEIAGDQGLAKATADLLAKLVPLPKE